MYRPLPSAGVDPALVGRVEALEARGPFRRHLLGIHAIVSGTSFAKSALLARDWMQGVDPDVVDVDLYLVAGGSAGYSSSAASATTAANGARPGGWGGDVRVVRALSLDDLVNGTQITIGAGAIGGSVAANPVSGGRTTFGRWTAAGGLGAELNTTTIVASGSSDLPIGRPGVTPNSAASRVLSALDSVGPGSGGAGTGDAAAVPVGGSAGVGDQVNGRRGGLALGNGSIDGESAAAESLSYGAGGAGVIFQNSSPRGGNGGFPGGGGGGVQWNSAGSPKNGGNGGNGVIRVAVYEWRLA